MLTLEELVKQNGDRIVYYREGTRNNVYVNVFDYSQGYGGTLNSYKYYNDYFIELGDNSMDRKREIEKNSYKVRILFDYSNDIKRTRNKEDVKKIVRLFFNDSRIEDVDFNDFIYKDVIPKLKELGVTFSEDVIDYEEVLKENY